MKTSASSSRVPASTLLLGVMVALALHLSGCCGGCCRAMLGTPSGSSGSSSPGLSDSPSSGSVSSLVASQVGSFRLKGTAPVTRLGSSLSPGVIDSVGAAYEGPGGEQLNQIILAYASAGVANGRMEIVYQTIARECPGKRLMRSEVRNRNGVVVGTQVVCDQSPQHVYWSNGRVLTFVTAPHPSALAFYTASGF